MIIPGMASDSQVYLNGEFMPIGQAKVSVLDRGFIFGDGIYEVVPVYEGKPFRIEHHLDRLARSLAAIRIADPRDRAGWTSLVGQLIERAPSPTCLVYLQVTRGVAKRDHGFPKEPIAPTVFGMVSAMALPTRAQREHGLSVITLPDERWLHCDIKSISLLGNVLAKQAAVDAGVDDVVMFRDGCLTEGSACNAWVAISGKLLAPPRDNLILEGIRYGLMGELAEQAGVPFEARKLSRDEVLTADEIMLTSAAKEVLPVVRIDGKPVGSGKPGPVYAKLRERYDALVAAL